MHLAVRHPVRERELRDGFATTERIVLVGGDLRLATQPPADQIEYVSPHVEQDALSSPAEAESKAGRAGPLVLRAVIVAEESDCADSALARAPAGAPPHRAPPPPPGGAPQRARGGALFGRPPPPHPPNPPALPPSPTPSRVRRRPPSRGRRPASELPRGIDVSRDRADHRVHSHYSSLRSHLNARRDLLKPTAPRSVKIRAARVRHAPFTSTRSAALQQRDTARRCIATALVSVLLYGSRGRPSRARAQAADEALHGAGNRDDSRPG